MKNGLCALGLALTLALPAGSALARTEGEKAVVGIGERLKANDCPGAVKALNAGLQAGYPEVALLAGTMFEAGFCVNKNWDKAMGFYTQAHDGGIREGALRLAAGFAAFANGPDPAAALWWAKRARLDADFCTARLPDSEDPDQFVAALRAWPAHDLELCNFVIGTISFIVADARYPMAGIRREVSGNLELIFTPAESDFQSKPAGVTRTGADRLSEVMVQSLRHAGARYHKPKGIPASWKISFSFAVDNDKSRWW